MYNMFIKASTNLDEIQNIVHHKMKNSSQKKIYSSSGNKNNSTISRFSCEYNNRMFSSTHRSLSKAIEAIKLTKTKVNRNNLLD